VAVLMASKTVLLELAGNCIIAVNSKAVIMAISGHRQCSLLCRIRAELMEKRLGLIWVKGHNGCYGNARADLAAKHGAFYGKEVLLSRSSPGYDGNCRSCGVPDDTIHRILNCKRHEAERREVFGGSKKLLRYASYFLISKDIFVTKKAKLDFAKRAFMEVVADVIAEEAALLVQRLVLNKDSLLGQSLISRCPPTVRHDFLLPQGAAWPRQEPQTETGSDTNDIPTSKSGNRNGAFLHDAVAVTNNISLGMAKVFTFLCEKAIDHMVNDLCPIHSGTGGLKLFIKTRGLKHGFSPYLEAEEWTTTSGRRAFQALLDATLCCPEVALSAVLAADLLWERS
ncbi:hypothetical protein FOL47_011356, partial [Perkinsus chesapeaki]